MINDKNVNQRTAKQKSRFTKDNILVCNDWLTGCVEWFLSEDNQISDDELHKKAYEQWLLTDLHDIGGGCLPDTVNTQKESFQLQGKYPLQMQYIVDISEPSYEQLRNLYNKKLDEADEPKEEFKAPIKKKRMLKLELTDGKKTIIGMEYSPIACLNTKIIPGSKIMLIGPLRCINGVLFLEPKNIKLLGGEVDTLLITNAFENILLKALNKPINPNPKTEYKEPIVFENSSSRNNVSIIENVPTVFKNEPNAIANNLAVIPDDDEFLLDIDLINIEQNLSAKSNTEKEIKKDEPKTATKSYKENKPIQFYEPEDDINFDDMEELENEINEELRNQDFIARKKTSPKPSTSAACANNILNNADLDIINDSILFDQSFSSLIPPKITTPKNKIEIKKLPTILDQDYPYRINNINLVTIDQLYTISDADKFGKSFCVFTEIETVVEKLQIKNIEWKLGVYLTDKSQRMLQARINTNVLTKLAGHTAEEMQELRKEQKAKPHIKDNIAEILTKLKESLQELQCFMKISYTSEEHPIVVELYDKCTDYENVLREKLINENIHII